MMLKKIKGTIKKLTAIRKRPVLMALFLAVIIIISGFYIYSGFFSDKQSFNTEGRAPDDPLVKAVKSEERYKQKDKQNLGSGDFDSYQYAKFNYAESYIKAKEYKKAADILDEIQKNVPADKLATDIYIYLADLAKQEGDNKGYKKYTLTLIEKLTTEKRTSEADYYKKQLAESGL